MLRALFTVPAGRSQYTVPSGVQPPTCVSGGAGRTGGRASFVGQNVNTATMAVYFHRKTRSVRLIRRKYEIIRLKASFTGSDAQTHGRETAPLRLNSLECVVYPTFVSDETRFTDLPKHSVVPIAYCILTGKRPGHSGSSAESPRPWRDPRARAQGRGILTERPRPEENEFIGLVGATPRARAQGSDPSNRAPSPVF